MQIPPTVTFDAGSSPGTPGTLNASGKPNIKRFYGKYRGKVIDNVDPLFLGRVSAIVPAVSEVVLTWAMPCVPYAGPGVGFYAIPPIDANVWIEFEGGDPDYPIWTGCFWEEGQVPLEAPPPGTVIFRTESVTLTINDLDGGGVILEITPPAVEDPISITLDTAGIQVVTASTISLTAQATNIASDAVSIESDDVNISGAVLTVESDATNFAGDTVDVESQNVTILAEATEILGEAVVIAGTATTLLSEVAVNIGGPIVSIEGIVSVEGDVLVDGMQVVVIPA